MTPHCDDAAKLALTVHGVALGLVLGVLLTVLAAYLALRFAARGGVR